MLPRRMFAVGTIWVIIIVALAFYKTLSSPVAFSAVSDVLFIAVPYVLIAVAPIAGYRIAAAVFGTTVLPGQPTFRLARYGRWTSLNPLEAREHKAFGPDVFMVSLMMGMLINIPIRTFEFMMAVPAMNLNAPAWGIALFQIMAFDVIAMNFLYAVCFVMALRMVPLFPRTLVFVWLMDVSLQIGIATRIGAQSDVPQAVATALADLLTGNISKVMISVAIWLPYLLLSDRINVTFRSRISAA